MRKIELEELKHIQLDIAQELHNFCIANDIKYSLACGTLLGGIRHGGYIPWDDDFDVYMEREDYNKFLSLYPKSCDTIYELANLDTNKDWHTPFCKMYDSRTLLIEKGRSIPIGVNIDIFPVDVVPSDMCVWDRYNKIRKFIVKLGLYKGAKPCGCYSLQQNIRLVIRACLMVPISLRSHALFVNWYAQRFKASKSATCLFENVQGIFQKRPFDKKDFAETILYKFEDREFCVMKGYDHCLTCGFGNYMQLPPEEKRVSHHSFKAFWKEEK